MDGAGDEKASIWRGSVLFGPLNWEINQGEDLADWIWKSWREAFDAKPFLQARKIASMFEEKEVASRSLPATSLVFGRNESASIGFVQIGDKAMRFALSPVRALILHVSVPARGPGGYAFAFEVQSPEATADGEHPQSCYVHVPFEHSSATTLDLLCTTLRMADIFRVAVKYEAISDV